MLFKNKNIVR